MSRKKLPPSRRSQRSQRDQTLKFTTPGGQDVELFDVQKSDEESACAAIKRWAEAWNGTQLEGVSVHCPKRLSDRTESPGSKKGDYEMLLAVRGRYFIIPMDPAEGISEWLVHSRLDYVLAEALK